MGTVRLDGERHSLIWIHDTERSVSVLVDRPSEGAERVRLLGSFLAEEPVGAIEALIADYREHHVKQPASERIPPRPLEPADLIGSAERPGGDRVG